MRAADNMINPLSRAFAKFSAQATTAQCSMTSVGNPWPVSNDTSVPDSGYASQASRSGGTTPENNTQPEFTLQPRRLFGRKPIKLKPFNKEIPKQVEDRFSDLAELFDKPLFDYVSQLGAKFTAISIKLKILGENEASAKPWILVLCDRSIVKRVREYFNQSDVKQEYSPVNLDLNLPAFQVIVCDKPPRPIGANDSIEVYRRGNKGYRQ